MAYTTPTTRALGSSSLWQRLGDLRADLAARVARHRNYRATLSELAMLSDRELADIGIHRSQIPEIAAETADAT